MCTADEIDIVLLVKLSHNSLTEREAHATIVVTICIDAALWVRPQ